MKIIPEDYASWARTTQLELNYPIPGHMEHYRRIYINEKGKGVTTEIRKDRLYYEYPKGTIIVKEVFPTLTPAADEKPMALTVMVKDPDNPESRGGWVWVAKNMQTAVETVFNYEFCFDCHTNANEVHPYGDKNPNNEFRDYVYFPYKGE